MKRQMGPAIVLLWIGTVGLLSPAMAQEHATPQEVIDKVREAAAFLEKVGAAGLKQFNDPDGQWAWKGTYVFVLDCQSETMAAHITNHLVGYDLLNLVDKNDNYLGYEICAVGDSPHGGWSEYWWPKPGGTVPFRKISYSLKVPGTPYVVGAGIYEPEQDLKSLEDLLR